MMINKLFLISIICLISLSGYTQSDLQVTSDGIIIPKANHTTIQNPDEGLLMFDPFTYSFWFYNGSEWEEIGNDNDKDETNELQNISASTMGDTLYLSDSNYLIVPGISAANYITDGDGNVYNEVEILGQIWLEPSIRSTTFNDGTPIDNPSSYADFWSNGDNNIPSYMWYDQDSVTYASEYGALYNWFTVDTASNANKNICPVGYHVPNITEAYQLRDTLSPTNTSLVGHHLKTIGNTYWQGQGGIDTYGFQGKGAGQITSTESRWLHRQLHMWSVTEHNFLVDRSWFIELNDFNSGLGISNYPKKFGHSIRCLKD
jgi:uncharacterized protein (TIGR02145 family)